MRIVVVGTGTDVGKTHVTTCLLAHTRAVGLRYLAYKPIATGVSGRCGDAEQHAAALGRPYLAPTFVYQRPVSPHLAAREEGRPIDLDLVRQYADDLTVGHDGVIVETAGGLFSPLSDTLTNADLVARLLPVCVLLVAPDRIGVLHDVGACLHAARACGVSVSALVLSAPSVPDASTSSNGAEIEHIGLGKVAGVFPRAPTQDPRSMQVARQVWAAIAPARL